MLLAALCTTLYLTTLGPFAAMHRLDRSVHWLHDPASQYIAGPHAMLFRWYGHIGTAAALLLTIQLFQSTAPVFASKVLVSMALLVMFRIGVVLVPTNAKQHSHHGQGATASAFGYRPFAVAYTAIASATTAFPTDTETPLVYFLIVTRYLALASLSTVVLTMRPSLKKFFGLAERVFLAATQLWFLSCSLWFVMKHAC